ncbi:MAG: hypothetical protein WA990_02310 [Rubrobacteraceae bacterium]
METQMQGESRTLYAERDLIPIPGNVPELGVKSGHEGVIEKLEYQNDRVYASVLVTYSTRQPRGSVFVGLVPEQGILSYTTA